MRHLPSRNISSRAMPPRTSWSNLIPGVIGLTLIVLLVIGMVMFAGVGRIRGKTRDVYVITAHARNVITGNEVWLSGRRIGVVERIDFRAPQADTLGSVVMTLRVRARDADLIRRNSEVQVRAGANIIGPIVVYVRGGTPDSPRLTERDTLVALTQSDLVEASARLEEVTAAVDPLMADARTVMAHMRNPRGTVGAFSQANAAGRVSLAELRTRITSFRGPRAGGGPGARDVVAQAQAALARVDSIRALLASPQSSLGRFRRDSTLGAAIASVTEELSALSATLADAEGTLPRLRRDSAMMNSVAAARLEMALLFEDIRKRPLRYLHF